jgi:D-glycerate 3-kinase|tara:strand:+ start:4262 stop:5203 length:942 start_codon:yes stop_codon:yes gene_type:complete
MDSDALEPDPLLPLLNERLMHQALGLGLKAKAGENLIRWCLQVARWLDEKISTRNSPYLLGINGAQGSGKTTFVKLLRTVMQDGFARHTSHLGLDDFYKPKQQRQALAEEVHPLLSTRGVPGTHDMELARLVIESLVAGEEVASPLFDKAIDDRLPESDWMHHAGASDLILFEGWCVGANSQPNSELESPVNSLEEAQDGDRVWRNYVNSRLQKGAYRDLFDRLDGLLMLQVPDMEAVFRWRWQQEEQLRLARGPQEEIMTRQQVRYFIMHYERLTRHMLQEMPQRADLVLALNAQHRLVDIVVRNASQAKTF